VSHVQVDYVTVAALVAAEQILGRRAEWEAANERQARFLTDVFVACRDETVPEIESLASWSADEISAFLAQRGFTLHLEPFAPSEFGSAAVLDLVGRWARSCNPTSLRTDDGRKFSAVVTEEDDARFFQADGHPNPIASLNAESGDTVWMTMHERPPEMSDLSALTLGLSRGRPTDVFGGLIFPMVDLKTGTFLSWLIGMSVRDTRDRPCRIAAARQETTLCMNEMGFRARGAGTILVERGGPHRRRHVINRPFLFWVERPGLARPLFVAWLTEEDWRRPPLSI